MGLDLSPSSLGRRVRELPAGFWAGLAVAGALIASYAPSIRLLSQIWSSEPNYTHGYLVAPIAALILWQRRDGLKRVQARPNPLGWLGLMAILGGRYLLYERNEMWLEQATIPLAAAALVLAFGGWGLLKWAAPGLLFLFLILPLPPRLNLVMAGPLQRMATVASASLLTLTGLPVLYEGQVIFVGTQPLEVARACNGLSMLMSFVTLITAVAIMKRSEPTWKRLVMLLSMVPIALITNILRIVATAWVYHGMGQEVGDKIAHDVAGWLMPVVALILVQVELSALSWLVVPDEAPEKPIIFLPSQPAPRPVKKKGPGPIPE
jgi:exosortase